MAYAAISTEVQIPCKFGPEMGEPAFDASNEQASRSPTRSRTGSTRRRPLWKAGASGRCCSTVENVWPDDEVRRWGGKRRWLGPRTSLASLSLTSLKMMAF
jgi:hypothetical protein